MELERPGGAGVTVSVHSHPSAKRIAGPPAQVADRLRAYAAAGVGEFLLSFSAHTVEETLAHMSVFA